MLLALLLAPLLPAPASAETKVDLELILMADASGSIDHEEFLLQRRGYARALRDPRVLDAILSGPLGRIALAYVEWSGPGHQTPIVPWTLIGDRAGLADFTSRLEDIPRRIFYGGTAPGNAILYGVASLQSNAYKGLRRVIDVSGDDFDIDGIPVAEGRDRAVSQGITVNGLPILDGWPALAPFFRDNVIGGPGAFHIPANDFRDFGIAVRKKLIREIVGRSEDRQQAAAVP
ncbi:MAG: DUF1194 domain-containing protein [Proteobacteria bacterium]|nr:DUF1194 domain-containing protein [Pseudomonadota bacterium]